MHSVVVDQSYDTIKSYKMYFPKYNIENIEYYFQERSNHYIRKIMM
jgi:hypothetical protein